MRTCSLPARKRVKPSLNVRIKRTMKLGPSTMSYHNSETSISTVDASKGPLFLKVGRKLVKLVRYLQMRLLGPALPQQRP